MSHLPPLFLRKTTFVRPHPNPKSLAGPPRSVMLRTSPWPGWVKGRLGLARTHKGPAAPLDRKSASHALDNDPWGGETTCLCFQLGRRLLHSQLWTLKTRLMFLATQSTGSQLTQQGTDVLHHHCLFLLPLSLPPLLLAVFALGSPSSTYSVFTKCFQVSCPVTQIIRKSKTKHLDCPKSSKRELGQEKAVSYITPTAP